VFRCLHQINKFFRDFTLNQYCVYRIESGVCGEDSLRAEPSTLFRLSISISPLFKRRDTVERSWRVELFAELEMGCNRRVLGSVKVEDCESQTAVDKYFGVSVSLSFNIYYGLTPLAYERRNIAQRLIVSPAKCSVCKQNTHNTVANSLYSFCSWYELFDTTTSCTVIINCAYTRQRS